MLPTDRGGNPDGTWAFGRNKIKSVGDCIVFKALDERLAHAFYEMMRTNVPHINIMPPAKQKARAHSTVYAHSTL